MVPTTFVLSVHNDDGTHTYYGPFDQKQAATEYATIEGLTVAWIAELVAP